MQSPFDTPAEAPQAGSEAPVEPAPEASPRFYTTPPRTIVWEDLLLPELRPAREALARAGVALTFSDLAAVSEAYNADLPMIPADQFEGRTEQEQAYVVREYADNCLERAMISVGERLIREGAYRPVSENSYIEVSPDPVAWPNGTVFQRTLETASMLLADDAKIAAMLEASDVLFPRSLPELGLLYDENDVAAMFKVGVSSLRAWRSKKVHFEYIKFPGQRGAIRYTHRGLVAFAMKHLALVEPQRPEGA